MTVRDRRAGIRRGYRPVGPRSDVRAAIVRGITARHDIRDRQDCERLVRAFYDRALHDPVIGFIFTDVARLDLEAHVPKVASFWETVLLGAGSYGGGAFRPHAALHERVPLRAGHFQRWLALWHDAVDAEFAGPVADGAKAHADRVALAFHGRLKTRPGRATSDAPPSGLGITRHPGGGRDPGPA